MDRGRGLASFGAASVTMALALGASPPVSAQTATTWPPPPELNSYELPTRELGARPRMSAAVGMGSSFDAVGFGNGTHAIPAFFATGGVGDGLLGVDFEAFASSAVGRFRNDNPVDRLALDAFGVVRPAAPLRPDDQRYRMRVLRSCALELGLGFERAGRTTVSGTRFAIHLGARVELPLTAAGAASELRLRLAASRNLGLYTPRLYGSTVTDVTEVGDTAGELFAALVALF